MNTLAKKQLGTNRRFSICTSCGGKMEGAELNRGQCFDCAPFESRSKREVNNLDLYIASSWKYQDAVKELTAKLRDQGHSVASFVEQGEAIHNAKDFEEEEWFKTSSAEERNLWNIQHAATADLVVYFGGSGKDAWAEVGVAFGNGNPIVGLWNEREEAGITRRLVKWVEDFDSLIEVVNRFGKTKNLELVEPSHRAKKG